MTDDKRKAREAAVAAALRPWLTPWGAVRAWLLFAFFIFAFSTAPRLLTGVPASDFSRWLLLEAGSALLASGLALLAGLLVAIIGGSIILALRRRGGG